MSALVETFIRIATGTLWPFNFAVWAGITVTLMLSALLLAAVAGRVVDPISVEAATRPGRAVKWMPLSAIGYLVAFAFFALSIVGAPVAVVLLFGLGIAGWIAYGAVATVWGDRLGRLAGYELETWQAAIIGVATFRLVSLIPFVGSTLHSLIAWFALGAVSAVMWDLAWSWHKRRLPDEVQFPDDGIIEWDQVQRGDGPPS